MGMSIISDYTAVITQKHLRCCDMASDKKHLRHCLLYVFDKNSTAAIVFMTCSVRQLYGKDTIHDSTFNTRIQFMLLIFSEIMERRWKLLKTAGSFTFH